MFHGKNMEKSTISMAIFNSYAIWVFSQLQTHEIEVPRLSSRRKFRHAPSDTSSDAWPQELVRGVTGKK